MNFDQRHIFEASVIFIFCPYNFFYSTSDLSIDQKTYTSYDDEEEEDELDAYDDQKEQEKEVVPESSKSTK